MSQKLATVWLIVVAVLASVLSAGAQQGQKKPLTLERLYRYPKLEGTAPEQPKWSADSSKLAFLWNDEGMPFLDLWVYDAGSGERVRLTSLPHDPDEWTTPASHRDKRLQQYLAEPTGLSGYEWAPDSLHLTFDFRGEIYIVNLEAELVRLTRSKDSEGNPKFGPGSMRLAYLSGGELFVYNLETHETVQLTSNGGLDIEDEGPRRSGNRPGEFKWSPDGEWIAFQQIDDSGVEGRTIANYSGERVTTRNQPWRIAREGNSKTRIGVVPAAGGNVVWLTKKTADYFYDWEWSSDSTRIALTRVEENQKNRRIQVLDFVAAKAEAEAEEENGDDTKKKDEAEKEEEKSEEKKDDTLAWVRTLYSESDEAWICTLCDFVVWSPDGSHILFSSERDGWNHLYLVAADGSQTEPKQLTSGAWEVEVRGAAAELTPRFGQDGSEIYFTANLTDHSRRDLFSVGVAGGEPRQLSVGSGFVATVVSPDDKWLAMLSSGFAVPWDLHVKANQAEVSAVFRVTQSPLPEFDEYEWPQPHVAEFPSRDGKTVRALLFYPPAIPVDIIRTIHGEAGGARLKRRGQPGKASVPIINFVHGAGYAQAVLDRWGGYFTPRFQFNQFLSQQGYLVIDVDYRGSSGYGRDWRTDVYLHLGGKDMEDELAAMDYLRGFGWADTDRAGVWGVSYGGFMTLMLMFKEPDAFQAGSAWAAVADWENYNRWYTQQRLRTPEAEPEAYKRSSPIHFVDGLKNALQIQHGIVDPNVHVQDALQLTDALVKAGKPFTQQFYPQSVHGWVRPYVWLHSTRSAFAFFERYLKGD